MTQSAEKDAPLRWSKLPLSAPAWLWVAYLLLVLLLMAWGGLAVIFCAAFSFQFWTFVVWRGLIRRVLPPGGPSA